MNRWSWNTQKKGGGTPGGYSCLLWASCKVRENHTCEHRIDCVWRTGAEWRGYQYIAIMFWVWHYQSILHLRELCRLSPPRNRQWESTPLFYRWHNSHRADTWILCRHNEIHWLAESTLNLLASSSLSLNTSHASPMLTKHSCSGGHLILFSLPANTVVQDSLSSFWSPSGRDRAEKQQYRAIDSILF